MNLQKTLFRATQRESCCSSVYHHRSVVDRAHPDFLLVSIIFSNLVWEKTNEFWNVPGMRGQITLRYAAVSETKRHKNVSPE
jgi:hypothetical protein